MGMAMESRFCVSCGRTIDFDAFACPYCGHDFRPIIEIPEDPISSNTRILFYLISFFVGIAGIILGIIYMTKPDPEQQHVGKICLIIGIFGSFVTPILLAAVLYMMVLGF